MKQDNKNNKGLHYQGKIRVFVRKTKQIDTWDDGYELSDSFNLFDDNLISGAAETSLAEVLTEEISMNGFDYFKESIQSILKKYKIGDVVEILADAYIEYSNPHLVGYESEHDAWGWLEDETHRKLSKSQIQRFASDLLAIDERLEKKHENAS
jgi:hypothetical protein